MTSESVWLLTYFSQTLEGGSEGAQSMAAVAGIFLASSNNAAAEDSSNDQYEHVEQVQD